MKGPMRWKIWGLAFHENKKCPSKWKIVINAKRCNQNPIIFKKMMSWDDVTECGPTNRANYVKEKKPAKWNSSLRVLGRYPFRPRNLFVVKRLLPDGKCSVLRRPDCGALWGFAFENRFFSFLLLSFRRIWLKWRPKARASQTPGWATRGVAPRRGRKEGSLPAPVPPSASEDGEPGPEVPQRSAAESLLPHPGQGRR